MESRLMLEGKEQMELLLKNQESGIFNAWEKKFIASLSDKEFEDLSSHQKAVIYRLIGWMQGYH